MSKPTAAAVLAGGQSRRMGRDKALIAPGGISLLERVVRVARSAVADVLVVGRDRPRDWPLADVPFLADETPGLGPIGGIQTALRHRGADLIVLGCDMPHVTAEALSWLSNTAEPHGDADGLAVRSGGRLQPLFAVYRLTCLSLIDRRVAEGKLSLTGLVQAGWFTIVEVPARFAPLLLNVNTPDDLAAL